MPAVLQFLLRMSTCMNNSSQLPGIRSSPVALVNTRLKEICPRGNNKVVIYITLYHDKCLLFMLELY